MGQSARTPTPIMITPLDLSEPAETAREWLNRHREIDGESAVTKLAADGPWGVVETHQGLFALNNEGVGPDGPITDTQPLEVHWLIRGYEDRAEDTFVPMFPACSSKFKPDEVRALATGEPVSLTDFVRTFGHRLDNNYESWRRLLEAASVTRV